MTDPPSTGALDVPPDFEVLGDLTGDGRVLRARRGGQEVVLRVSAGGERAEEVRTELSVLSALHQAARDPGLAAWVDQGLHAGRLWVAREWIDGEDLAAWAKGRSPSEIGRALARTALALGSLHRTGFAHADLKAGNVLVRPDGRPVLCDFGLARFAAQDAGALPGGTLFHVAPEVLLGAPTTPRADLFALGVLAHELLVGRRPSAREFYARFPSSTFFEAVGGSPADFPEWGRDVFASLLARDPDDRPESATSVARTLAVRLGFASEIEAELRQKEAPRWPVRRGREAWFASCAETFAGGPSTWVRAPEGEHLRAIEEALSITLALGEVSLSNLDVRDLDGIANEVELDHWAARTAATSPARITTIALTSPSAWRLRALEHVARAFAALPPERAAHLVVLARQGAPAGGPFREIALPEIDAEILDAYAETLLPEESPRRRREFTEWIVASGARAAAEVEAVLGRALERGVLLGGAPWRLRPGVLPAPESLSAAIDLSGLEPDAARLAQVLELVLGTDLATLVDLSALLEWSEGRTARALNALADTGCLRTLPGVRGVHVERARAWVTTAGSEDTSRIHAAIAAHLEARRAEPARILPHALYAGRLEVAAVVDEAGRLREEGRPERALELLDAIEGYGRGAPLDAALVAERGLVWTVLGDGERALAEASELERRAASDPSREAELSAWALTIRGRAALARNDFAAACGLFDAAHERVPDLEGERLYARVRRAYEERRYADVRSAVAALRNAGSESQDSSLVCTPRVASNLRTLAAMSAFHEGKLEDAREGLEAERLDALARADVGQEAATLLNIGTLERRGGDLGRAIESFERSVRLHDHAGLLRGAIQARAMLGGALREAGELDRAVSELRRAVELRERIGDESGAIAARGMLGLALADSGRPRAAITELETSAKGMAAHGRAGAGELFTARAELERARTGHPLPEASLSARAASGDPRILLWRGFAAWLSGNVGGAQELALAARQRAVDLRQPALAAEALGLHGGLNADEDAGRLASGAGRLADQDRRLAAWLTSENRSQAEGSALVDELSASGRGDRAVRALLALCLDEHDPVRQRGLSEALREAFERAAEGLDEAERAAFALALIGRPDPLPQEIERWPRPAEFDEETDMDLLSLLDINHQLLEQKNLTGLLESIVEHALRVTGAERGFLVLEERGDLRFDRALDSSLGDIDEPDLEVSRSIVTGALETMRTQRVSNAVDDPLLSGAPSVVQLDLRSVLCAPFKVDSETRGVVYVDHRLRTGAFTERDERMLGLLADQAGLAILQIARLEEIRQLNERLSRRVARRESDLAAAHKALRVAGLAAPASGLVGSSAAMRSIHEKIAKVAAAPLPVLVVGPSGSGKELAARALHSSSPRRAGPLVSENCAALPASLIESELFGYRKGAFTGANEDRKGMFERADGGTLFLDEIGELPIELQAKLLRVLETGEVRRIGDSDPRSVDVRLVCATNRDLPTEVGEGRFRADLYYRLDGLTLRLPSLSERTEDIPELVEHFLRIEAAKSGVERHMDPVVMRALCRRAWPGNVRELANEVARLCVLSDGDVTDPELVRRPGIDPDARAGSATRTVVPFAQLEREAIEHALEVTGGDKRKAAELLGMSRAKIYQRIKAWEGDEKDD